MRLPVRLLNLDRSTERLALFRARNGHVPGIERVAAVDGKQVNRKGLVNTGVLAPELAYTDGAIGCALSHLAQWRDAIQTETALTVVEDDAVLCANFAAESARIIASLPSDWEYVMWGYNFDAPLHFDLGQALSPCVSHFDQETLRAGIGDFAATAVASAPFRLVSGFGTICYSISPRGAMRLLEFCLPLRPMATHYDGLKRSVANNGIDIMMAQVWPQMRAYVAVPPLAVTENDAGGSTIQRGAGVAPPDPFAPRTLLDLCADVQTDTPIAIGIRASSDAVLPTAALRARGWGGFDIAAEPRALAQALHDRAVPRRFDLLYVGPGCNPADVLGALLPAFQPDAAILAPEPFIDARALPAWRARRAPEPGAAPNTSYAALAEAERYAIHSVAAAPAYTVLTRAEAAPHAAAHAPRPAQRADTVRLWQ